MSDLDLIRCLDELEQVLEGNALEPEDIAAWQARFDAACAEADRGTGWVGIVNRAHALATRIDMRTGALVEQRDQIRKELDLQAQGARALRGYRSR